MVAGCSRRRSAVPGCSCCPVRGPSGRWPGGRPGVGPRRRVFPAPLPGFARRRRSPLELPGRRSGYRSSFAPRPRRRAHPHLAVALHRPKARTRDRHRGAGHTGGRYNTRDMGRIYVERHGSRPDPALLHLGGPGLRIGSDSSHDLGIASTHHRTIRTAQPHRPCTPCRSETGARNRHLRAGRAGCG